MKQQPLIVAIGGSTTPGSTTQTAMQRVLDEAASLGARTVLLSGDALNLPLYSWKKAQRRGRAAVLIDTLRSADGVILGSPGYHGNIAGVVKNAIDYIEDLRTDARPYLTGRAVGCLSTAGGWQAAVSTMQALRDVVHALRGWPTPMGVAINTGSPVFDVHGQCLDPKVDASLRMMATEILSFATGALPAGSRC